MTTPHRPTMPIFVAHAIATRRLRDEALPPLHRRALYLQIRSLLDAATEAELAAIRYVELLAAELAARAAA